MELTREQIEACAHRDSDWPTMLRHREDTELLRRICDLALRALDQAADARLGRAVREAVLLCGLGEDSDTKAIESISNRIDYLDRKGVDTHGAADITPILDAVVEALREEAYDADVERISNGHD
jgi:hypothetical protein